MMPDREPDLIAAGDLRRDEEAELESLDDQLNAMRGARYGGPAPPPTPPGWKVVPHPDPNVVAYEVSGPMRTVPTPYGPASCDFSGTNAVDYQGFPADTLEIARVGMHVVPGESGFVPHVSYRFHYRASGWQLPPGYPRKPSCDFHRLPL